MKDAKGAEIAVGSPVRFVHDPHQHFTLGCVTAVIDDETVALASPTFCSALAKNLVVMPTPNKE